MLTHAYPAALLRVVVVVVVVVHPLTYGLQFIFDDWTFYICSSSIGRSGTHVLSGRKKDSRLCYQFLSRLFNKLTHTHPCKQAWITKKTRCVSFCRVFLNTVVVSAQ